MFGNEYKNLTPNDPGTSSLSSIHCVDFAEHLSSHPTHFDIDHHQCSGLATMNCVVIVLLCWCCCLGSTTAGLLNLPSIDSLASQGTSTYMEHHSNTPQFDRQYDTAPDYSAGEYKGQLPVDPPGYAIQEGYEGFLVPMKSGVVTGLITALVIVSVLLGLLVLKVLKLPFLVLLLLKFKKILKLKWLQLKLKKIKKPVGRLLADDHHLLQLTRFIFSAIDRLASLQDQTTQSN